MKFYQKLIEQLYFFDYNINTNFSNIPVKEVDFYMNKLHRKFNIKQDTFDYYMMEFYNIDNNVNTYYDEGNKMTIVFDNYILKISKSIEEYNFMEQIKNKKLDNFIIPEKTHIDIESKSFIYFIKKYNPIIDSNFIKKDILLKFIVDLNNCIETIENFGYYHREISVNNIVYQIIDETKELDYNNIIFKLIGYGNLKNNEDKQKHIFRKSVKNILGYY